MANSVVSVPGSHRLDLTVHGHDSDRRVLGGGHDTFALPSNGVSGQDTMHLAVHGTNRILALEHTSLATAAPNAPHENAVLGRMTLLGGSASREFLIGGGPGALTGAKHTANSAGVIGHDTVPGGSGKDPFEFFKGQRGAAHLIKEFVVGHDKLYLEGHTLASLRSGPDTSITSHGGNTYIALDGGRTTIELHGVAHLKPTDFTNKH